jgi:hypothetical protein
LIRIQEFVSGCFVVNANKMIAAMLNFILMGSSYENAE